MSTLFYLVWLIWILNKHTFFSCQEISGTEDIRYIKIQQSFKPSLWSWPWPQHSNPIFSKIIHLMMMYHQSKLSCERISSSDNIKSHIFIILSLTVTLILKTANQPACMTLWTMMKHYYTKFGYKRYSSSGDIIQLNSHWNFEHFLWPWSWKQSNFYTKHSSLW